MGAVAARLRAELRTRWRGSLAVVVLIGALGGIVLTTAAGARRTETAYPRLLDSTGAADFLISVAVDGLASGIYDEVERLPQVAAAGTLAGVNLVPVPDGPLAELASVDANASADGRYGSTINRPKLLAGRLPDPGNATEVLANREMARVVALSVGDRIPLLAPLSFDAELAEIQPTTYTVVGIGLFTAEVVPGSLLNAQPRLLLTPAYLEAHRGTELNYDGIAVRLHPGADRDQFRRELQRLGEQYASEVGEVFIGDEATFQAKTERAIRPQAVALAVFALLTGAASLLVVGQTLSRQLASDAHDYPVLRALGMTRGQLLGICLARVGGIGALGGILAVGVAIAASPLMPVGPARDAEPTPGLTLDGPVMGVGFVAIVVLLVTWVLVPVWRRASAPAGVAATAEPIGVRRPSWLARAATAGGLPPPATTGIRMALEPGRGRAAVPVRSALAGVAVAIAAVVTAATFAANLQRLVSTPSLFGRSWDVALDTGFGAIPLDAAASILDDDSAVTAYAGGRYAEVAIDGQAVPAVGIDLLEGEVFPTLLQGRPPLRPDEIVLGTTSLRRLGRAVGDSVVVEVEDDEIPMEVVGRAVFPRLGRGSFPPTGLGEGAAVAAEVVPLFDAPPGAMAYSFYLVRFADDASGQERSVLSERFEALLCRDNPEDCFLAVDTDQRPADVSNYERVQSTPMALAGVLVVLAVAALGHTLVTWVRRRRRDLAVHRALGFVHRQVSATVTWQATTLAVLALMIGLPLGVAIGRWLWLLFAAQLGVAPEVVVPPLPLLVAVPATLVVANLVAAVPGWQAGRVQPAVALRSE
jgi:ABC-type antimicrobial peptide transport system permease subunit